MSNRHKPTFKEYVGLNVITGANPLFKFGKNPDIDTTPTVETVWDAGNGYTFLSAASTASVVSDSANDNGTVIIYGLDSNYDAISETLTMNGLTPVVSTKSFLRVYRAIYNTPGSLNVTDDYNDGTITGTISATTVFQIMPTESQTAMGIYTVPRNHILMTKLWMCGLGKQTGAVADFHFEIRPYGGTWQLKQVITLNTNHGSFERNTPIGFRIDEKSDIRVRVHDCSTNNCVAITSFDGIVYDMAKWTF